MEKDIGKIEKGEFQGAITEIVIGIREYNGRVGVDIREFVSSERYTGPTKKGLRIPAEKFLEFRELINKIEIKDLDAPASSEQPEAAATDAPEQKIETEKIKETTL